MTKLGEFKAIGQILDEIDAMLIRMPEVPELEKQRLAAKKFREEFEKTQKNHSEDLFGQVIVLSANLTLSTLGSFLPELRISDERINKNDIKINGMHQTKNKEVITRDLVDLRVNLLMGLLSDVTKLNANDCRKKIDSIEMEFEELEFCSQDFDKKLSEAQYELMKKYLIEGKEKEAEEYAQKFSSNMKIYAYERLKSRLPKLKENLRTEEIKLLTDYMMDNKISENTLEFWEMVMRIENPELKLGARLEEDKYRKDDKKSKKWKEHVIKCDSTMPETGISYEDRDLISHCRAFIKDYKTKQKYIKKGYNIKLKFETGIKKIPNCDHNLDFSLTHLIKEVEIPETVEQIGNEFFSYFIMDELDLSKTQLKTLNTRIIWIFRNRKYIFPKKFRKNREIIIYGC